MTTRNPPTCISVGALLAGGDRYRVPIYQRNYAWEEAEITQLIDDVIDFLESKGNYYIGTLVVAPVASRCLEVVDGQQRLTTLSLLAAYLRPHLPHSPGLASTPCLEFECRMSAQEMLAAIYAGTHEDCRRQQSGQDSSIGEDAGRSLLSGWRVISKVLPQRLKEKGVSECNFARYLLEGVHILRVEVPEGTDLNHYFEIMNSRGEQLEKHEVLKARLLSALERHDATDERPRSQHVLHRVWEACANMEKYVQAGFSSVECTALFGTDWSDWRVTDFRHVADALDASRSQAPPSAPLVDLLRQAPFAARREERVSGVERFHGVINFPNFLLHVLRVMSKGAVPLDDKRLLESFDEFLLRGADRSAELRPDVVVRINEFVLLLLKCKFLLDRYVIKREFLSGKDSWSLKACRRSKDDSAYYHNSFGKEGDEGGINLQVLMLISAFHVSMPTMSYKYWLDAALFWLQQQERVEGGEYLEYMESVAAAFVFDRYLVEDGLDYEEIVYRNDGRCIAGRGVDLAGMELRLSYGNIANNLVFNYLDYLLWRREQRRGKASDAKILGFHFTFRSSVEHHYPQNPINGVAWPDETLLNSFGNLCLISHSKNSRLSNFMPGQKKDLSRGGSIDSIKQHLMMAVGDWTMEAAKKHKTEMMRVLLNALPD